MGAEIIALKCPSCGSATDVEARAVRFGYRFDCRFCRTSSVLILNNQLYILTPNEHVCLECGRVATARSRYCQCGALLVQTCRACDSEIARDHQICDQCGCDPMADPASLSAEDYEKLQEYAAAMLRRKEAYRRRGRAPAPPSWGNTRPPSPAAAKEDPVARLRTLKPMLDGGLTTDDESEAKKKEIVNAL